MKNIFVYIMLSSLLILGSCKKKAYHIVYEIHNDSENIIHLSYKIKGDTTLHFNSISSGFTLYFHEESGLGMTDLEYYRSMTDHPLSFIEVYNSLNQKNKSDFMNYQAWNYNILGIGDKHF